MGIFFPFLSIIYNVFIVQAKVDVDARFLIGVRGFEPPTFCAQWDRSLLYLHTPLTAAGINGCRII
jgi:hypothetical protein